MVSTRSSSMLQYTRRPTFLTMNLHQKTATRWLSAKRHDDDTSGLWRVKDKLYDLSPFVARHPGGSDWIVLTRGTDITELFEISHLTNSPEAILQEYHVKDASVARYSPYTFDDNGFYRTFKKKAVPILKRVGTGPTSQMLLVQDGLLLVFLVTSIISVISRSYVMAAAAGFVLSWTMICSHNFFHQRNNWRMYIFNLSFISYMDWRISHVLSHHVYTNTVLDWEVMAGDPLYQILPKPKTVVYKCTVLVYFHLQNLIGLPLEFGKKVIGFQRLNWCDFFWLVELGLMARFSDNWTGVLLWTTLHVSCSYWFLLFGLTGAHHHPESFHDGDSPRKDRDWGLCQLDAVADRPQIDRNIILTAALFGQHALHHMFPTVDHSKLHHLKTVFEDTCRQFGVEVHRRTLQEMFKGLFRQLLRTACNMVPADKRKYTNSKFL